MADIVEFVNPPSDTKPTVTADRALVISYELVGDDIVWDIRTNYALAPEPLEDDEANEIAVRRLAALLHHLSHALVCPDGVALSLSPEVHDA